MDGKFFHSVTLDKDACRGCTNCIKRCPTEAIRVRDGKARILSDRCIDCGECIRICPHHAKKAIYDHLAQFADYTYKIALPAPALYAQFNNLEDPDLVLSALREMGFDEVFQVASAAEMVSDETRQFMASGAVRYPVISSACPTVTRLIRVRFPELIDNVLPLLAPAEIAARIAKDRAAERTGISRDRICALFISPCPAKVTAAKMPMGTDRSDIDGVLAISDVYPQLLAHMRADLPSPERPTAGRMGVGWGSSGGEAAALLTERYLAADGIENVIKVLEDLEDQKYPDLSFVELNACSAGCVGGVLTVENPYIAKAKLIHLRRYLPVSCNAADPDNLPYLHFERALEFEPVLRLDPDMGAAMVKMQEIDEIAEQFEGIDCGACGAPSCRALAEDVVRGFASPDDCVFMLSHRMQNIASSLAQLEVQIPHRFRSSGEAAGAQDGEEDEK